MSIPDCDYCGDKIELHNSGQQMIVVKSVTRDGSGPVTDMLLYPEIERDHHFCALKCLAGWLSERKNPGSGRPYCELP